MPRVDRDARGAFAPFPETILRTWPRNRGAKSKGFPMKNNSQIDRTKNLVRSLLADRKGVTAIEYGLIAGIIAVGIVAVLGAVSNNLIGLFGTISGALMTPH